MKKIGTAWGHLVKSLGWQLLSKLIRGVADIIDNVVNHDNVKWLYLINDLLKTALGCSNRAIKHATIYHDMKIGK